MKLKLTFKTPDVIDFSLNDLFITYDDNDEKQEVDEVDGLTRDDIAYDLRKYIEYGEYLTVEYDTDTKKMAVIPV